MRTWRALKQQGLKRNKEFGIFAKPLWMGLENGWGIMKQYQQTMIRSVFSAFRFAQ